MSLLEELLNKHCPDGVEYVPLWSVTIWDKKFNSVDKEKQSNTIKYKYYLADELKQLIVPNGNVKILTTNCSDLFTLEELVNDTLTDSEIVCIPWGGNPIVQYYKGKFITGDNRIAASIDINKLDNKFLYYVLMNKLDLISSFYRGAGIKHPDMSKVLDIAIPLPPIEVQKEIVRILDIFTELTKELTKELKLRKKQYEYYRDKLLTFGDDAEWKELKKVCTDFIVPMRDKPKIFNGNIPWCRIEDVEGKYFNTSLSGRFVSNEVIKEMNLKVFPIGTVICSCSASLGTYAINTQPLITNQTFIGIVCGDKLNNKYLRYYMETQTKKLISLSNSGTIPYISRQKFEDLKIPVPPLEEQERIVKILDRFDALVNDITSGLPAEIEMRKKQYEYYRDKLLTFNEKKN